MVILEGFKLSQCRGLESGVMDSSSKVIVVEAPVAMVGEAIAQLNSQAKIHAEAFDRAIQAREQGIILFQLRGFDWTVLYKYKKGFRKSWIEELLSQLSDRLETRAMFLEITDTAPYIYHQIWESGESVEHFLYDYYYVDENDYIGESKVLKLESQIRQVSEADVSHNALNDFYSEQGVYFPDLQITSEPLEQDNQSSFTFKVSGIFDWCLSEQFKGISSEDCLKSYSLERDDFEGFDYITFDD